MSFSSRERLLAAMRHQQTDYIPLLFHTFGFRPPAHLAWSNEVEEAERWLSLGVDAVLRVHPSLSFHPDVTVRDWVEHVVGERWPLLVKEYHTPAGVIRQEVYRTDDWVSDEWGGHDEGDHTIHLLDDYNVPRSRRFAVETEEDLEKLKYLFSLPSDQSIRELREQAAAVARHAQRLGCAVESIVSAGTDAATWLCGVDGMVLMAMDRPEMFTALLDIIQARDRRITEVLLDTPVDIVIRRGWYEGTAFWSPALYERFFLPRFRELVELAHGAGRLMGYMLSTGFMPLLELFTQAGYDVHYYIDPLMGGAGTDLGQVKRRFDGRIAVVGGVNSPVTLERGSREEIRQAVAAAIAALGPRGLVLGAVDCIAASTPWESVAAMIEAWREGRTGGG